MRERHGPTVATLESIQRNTGMPYRLIYAGGPIPSWLREILLRRAEEWRLEILEFDDMAWPNQIRKRVAPILDTPYVAFVDNDVWVAPGWLESLVACADETGAGIVCPLYLIGDPGTASKIHMAGGRLTVIKDASGTLLREESLLKDEDLTAAAPKLRRARCDFAEYHCALMRTELAKHATLFDERIVCVHEHIDAALTATQAGYPIYFEPAARVTYSPYETFRLSELATFRARWDPAAVDSSIKAFCAKWGVIDDWRSFGAIRVYMEAYPAQHDPLRPAAAASSAADRPMQSQELRQTLSGLFDLAQSRGFSQEEWDMVQVAYRLAMVLTNGVYRPCGRPFINHLVGTASVLVHYNFRSRVVGAGLLHAAYTHGSDAAAEAEANVERIDKLLGGKESRLEARVRAYTLRSSRWRRLMASADWQLELSVEDAEILAMIAANEVDMHLSGEFRFSGRRDMETRDVGDLMTYACGMLGVPGLAETVRIEAQKLLQIAPKTDTSIRESFRLVGDRLVPALNPAVIAALQRNAALA
jgi:hypothetical protein